MKMKDLKKLAKNSEPLKDTIVYRGFIDEAYDPDIEYGFDDTLVMITPLGEFKGSSADGKPTKEIIDEESVKLMASQVDEILLDRDHASMRNVDERDSSAMGWISGLKAITNLGDMSGLYGVIKWCGEGIQLVKDRVYRFLSPVFELDENGHATKLVNVALTNRPALKMPPILNGEPTTENQVSITNQKKDTDDMNKDEIKAMIQEMVKEAISLNLEPTKVEVKAEFTDKAKEDKEYVVVQNAEPEKKVCEKCGKDPCECKKEEVQNSCEEDNKEVQNSCDKKEVQNSCEEDNKEVQNSCDKKEDVVKNEESKEEEKKEEVIKVEALNSQPAGLGTFIAGMEAWRNLHGEEFFKYIKTHKV